MELANFYLKSNLKHEFSRGYIYYREISFTRKFFCLFNKIHKELDKALQFKMTSISAV